MKRIPKALILILGITSVLCCGILYVYVDSLTYNPRLPPRKGPINISYRIDPETILTSLDRGDINVFTLKLGISHTPVSDKVISWRQADYLKIANAVFRFAWKGTFDDWHVGRMKFSTPCHENPEGVDEGHLYFFKADGESGYSIREILITPRYGEVLWGEKRIRDAIWEGVDLNRARIAAEDALRIAEES